MGLIEKAGGVFGDDLTTGIAAQAAPDPGLAASSFNIDFERLAAQGFYAPTVRSSRMALELRQIKRRLLRRLGLRNASGEKRLTRRGGRPRNLVLVTSTRPGEGKTFCSINLALSFACEDALDVLLVDADSPRPKVRATFGLAPSRGLTDRLRDPALPVSTLLTRASEAPLSILSEGAPVLRAGDLYAGAEAQRLFAELSARRDGRLVIIDAPPVLATDEAVILARHVDEVIFIVEADATPEKAAAAALDELLEANSNVSLVLNRCLIAGGAAHYGSYADYDRDSDANNPVHAGEIEGKTT